MPGRPSENFTITNRGQEYLRTGLVGELRAFPRNFWILEALQYLPELQLDPRITIISDNRIQWNGKDWDGELFVQLIRKK